MVTKYMSNCIVCGKPAEHVHHLVYGRAHRRLSDEDQLVLGLCFRHHEEIHKNGTLGVMSKIIGQLAYERDKCAEGMSVDESRESFRKRYGISYL